MLYFHRPSPRLPEAMHLGSLFITCNLIAVEGLTLEIPAEALRKDSGPSCKIRAWSERQQTHCWKQRWASLSILRRIHSNGQDNGICLSHCLLQGMTPSLYQLVYLFIQKVRMFKTGSVNQQVNKPLKKCEGSGDTHRAPAPRHSIKNYKRHVKWNFNNCISLCFDLN